MKNRFAALSAALALSCMATACTATASAADQNWTRFQNAGLSASNAPDRTGDVAVSPAWEAPVQGYGQSSPVVWGDQVFLTSVSGNNKDTFHVAAYDLRTGEVGWSFDVKNATPTKSSTYVSRAAPTPAVDRESVFCFFEGGNLVCLDHSGKPQWQRNLVEDYGPISARHGLSSSVELSTELAFVWVERSEAPYVIAVDKKTGETRWKAAGAGATSWASPRLLDVDGGQHLVLSAIGSIRGIDVATGKLLWTVEGVVGNSSPTPTPVGKGMILVGATVGRGETGSGQAAKSNGVIKVAKQDDESWKADYTWRATKATSSFGSPAHHEGVAYFVNRSGVLFGLDARTGEELFARRIGDSIWATPIAVPGFIVFPRKDGVLAFVQAGREFKLASETPIFEEIPEASTLYATVIVGNHVLSRIGNRLVCQTMEIK